MGLKEVSLIIVIDLTNLAGDGGVPNFIWQLTCIAFALYWQTPTTSGNLLLTDVAGLECKLLNGAGGSCQTSFKGGQVTKE